MMKNDAEKFNKKFGYIFGYFLFTTIVYFILTLLKRIPQNWTYLHIMGITLIITIIGISLKKLLR